MNKTSFIKKIIIAFIFLFTFLLIGCNKLTQTFDKMLLDSTTETVIGMVFIDNCDESDINLDYDCCVVKDLEFITEFDGVIFEYSSNNPRYLNDSGIVKQDGSDHVVTITVYCYLKDKVDINNTVVINVLVLKDANYNPLNEYLDKITFPEVASSNLLLPTCSQLNFEGEIYFESSDQSLLTNEGVIKTVKEDTLVTFTVKLVLGEISLSKPFTIKLLSNYVKPTDEEVINSYLDSLVLPTSIDKEEKLVFVNSVSYEYKGEKYVLVIKYTSSDEEIISSSGEVNLPLDDSIVSIYVSCSLNEIEVTKKYDIEVKKEIIDESILINEALDSITLNSEYNSNITLVDKVTVTYRGKEFTYEVKWTSNSDSVTSSGVITQTLLDEPASLTCSINGITKDFNIIILKRSLNDLELLDKVVSEFSLTTLENGNYDFINTYSVFDNYNDVLVNLSYSSSNTDVLSNTGVVTKQTNDTSVTLIVTFTLNGNTKEKEFDLVIEKRPLNTLEVLSIATQKVDFDFEVTSNLTLNNSLEFIYNDIEYLVDLSYTSSNEEVLTSSGVINQTLTDELVTLTVTFTYNNETISESYDLLVKARKLTDIEVVNRVYDLIEFDSTISEDLSFSDTYTYLFNDIEYICNLSYTSSNEEVIANSGKVTLDDVVHNVKVTLVISKGESTKTKEFSFEVLASDEEITEILVQAYNGFNLETTLTDNLQLESSVIVNERVVNITYKSSNSNILTDNGVINRDIYDREVTFSVTFEYQMMKKTKTFNVIVKGRDLTELEVLELAKAQIVFEKEITKDLEFNSKVEVVVNDKTYVCDVEYSTNNVSVITNEGKVFPQILDSNVRINYTITYNGQSLSSYSSVKVIARMLNSNEVFDRVKGQVKLPNEVDSDISLMTSYVLTYNSNTYEVLFSYSSSDVTLIDNSGKVTRNIIDKEVVMTVTLSYGSDTFEVNKTIKVLKRDLNSTEIIAKAKEILTLPDVTESNIDFNNTITFEFESKTYQVLVSYSSSDESVISNTGEVTCDSIERNITITVTFTDSNNQSYSESFDYVITVLEERRLTQEEIDSIISEIEIPNEIYQSIGLITENQTYPDLVYTYTSTHPELLSVSGEYNSPLSATLVDLELTITYKGNEIYNHIYTINVICDSYLILDYANDFDGIPVKNTYGEVITSTVQFYCARTYVGEEAVIDESNPNGLDNNYLRGRTRNGTDNFTIESVLLNNLKAVKFTCFKPTSSYESIANIKVYTKTASTEYVLIDTVTLNLAKYYKFENQTTFEYLFDLKVPTQFKLVFESNSTNYQIGIDNFEIYRDITAYDFDKYLMAQVPTSTSKSITLPTTTIYGGSVSYVSSDPSILSNTGEIINSPVVNTQVQLTATINHLGKVYVSSLYVTVLSNVGGAPVEIFFIDIGKYGQSDCGECIYIRYGDIDIIVDAADSHNASKKAVSEAINLYLQDDAIDYVIATHPDADHIGGMPAIFEEFTILNCIIFDGTHTSQKYTNFVNSYTNEGCNVINIYEDLVLGNKMRLSLSNEVYIDFMDTMYYNDEVSKETNGRSIVFVLNSYQTRVLFTGDADNGSGHTNLEANYQNVCGNIDILKVVHHGTKQGTSPAFLKAVDPEVAIICNGNYLGNKHSHPHVETIKNLYSYDSNMKVYCITGGGGADECEITSAGGYECSSTSYMQDRNGTIHVTINMKGYTIESEYFASNPIEIKDTVWWKGYLRTVGAN